jgi:hypothetical protein
VTITALKFKQRTVLFSSPDPALLKMQCCYR